MTSAAAAIARDKRTTRAARAVMVLFFGVFLAMGSAFLYGFFIRPVMRIAMARDWTTVACRISTSRVEESHDSDGTTYRVAVTYRYEVDGRSYAGDRYKFSSAWSSGRAGKQRVVDRLRPGTVARCYADPDNPSQSVIDRGLTADLWFGLIPLIFVIVGGGGVGAALFGNWRGLGARSATITTKEPAYTPYTRASGPRMLVPRMTRRGKLIGLVVFTLFWNGILAVFLQKLVSDWRSSVFSWMFGLFLLPFIAVGILMVVLVVRQIMLMANPRTALTVSSDRVALGDELRVQWAIEGDVDKLLRLRIDLEGREEATYRRGTTNVTDVDVFASISILDEARPVNYAGGTERVKMPSETMHSFEAASNKVVWLIRVRGEVPNWPDSDDEFRLTVTPHRR